MIKSYLEIERARFEERLVVTIDIPRELETMRIPSLILQPLVENAMKHGISKNRNGGEVCIAAKVEQGSSGPFVSLVVSDTGSGRKGIATTGAGVGLTNIRERLASYYDGKADFSITTDQISGTRAEIRLPQAKTARQQAFRAIEK